MTLTNHKRFYGSRWILLFAASTTKMGDKMLENLYT